MGSDCNTPCCKESGNLGRLIYQTSLMLQNYADRLLRPYELTMEQFHPLKVLHEAGRALTQRQICEAVQKSPANMTRILDRLESKKLLSRMPNPEDRRAFLVALTDKGMNLLSEVAVLFAQLSGDFLSGIEPAKRQMVQEVLVKMMANIERMTAELEPPKQ